MFHTSAALLFMTLIKKALGKNVTTPTWDTIMKCAVA
jgi:hypothetical protein